MYPPNTVTCLDFQKYFLNDQIKASQVSSLGPKSEPKQSMHNVLLDKGSRPKSFPVVSTHMPLNLSVSSYHQFTSISGTRIAKKESEASGD